MTGKGAGLECKEMVCTERGGTEKENASQHRLGLHTEGHTHPLMIESGAIHEGYVCALVEQAISPLPQLNASIF